MKDIKLEILSNDELIELYNLIKDFLDKLNARMENIDD